MARGGGVSLGMLASAGIGILVLAVVLPRPDFKKEPLSFLKSLLGANMLAPVIGGQMETAMPALSSRVHQKICNTLEANGATSGWNATYRARFLKRSPPGSKQHRTQNRSGCVGAVRENGLKNKHGFGNAPLYIPLPDRGWACDSCSHHYLRASRSFFDVSEGHDGPQGIAKDHPPEDPGKGPPSFHHEPWCFG